MMQSNKEQQLRKQLHQIARLLINSNSMLSTAESCTGGMIASAITDIPGSSQWFWGGFVTYTSEAKTLLGVPEECVTKFGTVSQIVAQSMANNAAEKAEVAYALSVTGIAGPDGGSDLKPVGTVCFGWCIEGIVSSEEIFLKGCRETIRRDCLIHAISGLLARI